MRYRRIQEPARYSGSRSNCGSCGWRHSAEWEARWPQASTEAAALAAEDGTGDPDPPYRGLARYETGDSGRFFGRQQLTGDLLGPLRRERFA
ncbi:hypothetical protein ACFYYH_15605 [Streptomyces sp. NPDC002018]|uniref:nSTAND1 domain-containing NTPase n=1 Tax=Streptomyces sp. NPDC002018 TaxID=3364629 RepID=UPI0036CF7852